MKAIKTPTTNRIYVADGCNDLPATVHKIGNDTYTEACFSLTPEEISQIIYSIIYVIFFLIDDIIIFFIAMKTLEIKAISNKFGKYSHLIGGIIMLIIGFLMLYKPEWLMFNF